MSFILDALKKSEAERQRQSGPTLLELRVSPQRRRYPLWALWVGVLLALNAGILLFVLFRRPTAPTAVSLAGTRLAAIPVAVAPLPVAAPAPSAPSAPIAPPAATLATVAPLASASGASNAVPAAAPASASANPADDAPALPPGTRTNPPPPPPAAAPTSDYEGLPNLSSLGGSLPTLQLNLLDYSELATERYALVNMHRVREGDVLPEGPRVLAIMRDGVAMDFNGQQFMLRSSTGATP
jgi:general secretion pathway protein B